MNELSKIQVRVLGCLIEKKETTPEQYPLTLNAVRNACNQKTARFPATSYTEGEVGHTLRELESMGYSREAWGARAAKYEHAAAKVLGIHSQGLALLCPLMLRGPQTLGELKINSHRLHEFDDLDDLRYALKRLSEHEPPLVVNLPRQPGQKEERFAHLLSGEPEIPAAVSSYSPPRRNEMLIRVEALEAKLEVLQEKIAQLEDSSQD